MPAPIPTDREIDFPLYFPAERSTINWRLNQLESNYYCSVTKLHYISSNWSLFRKLMGISETGNWSVYIA